MKVEYKLFIFLTPFFALIGVVYGLWSGWEPVGSAALLLTAGLSGMIGAYLALTAKRIDARPEDDPDGLIEQGAGDQGVYAPWSWWPLAIAGSAAIVFLGLAVGWWLVYVGIALSAIALVGWVFEFSRGQHAH
ncbi:cytochrome c oxidase subunit 4 [Cellulosimicrobium cellulans]|uniref:cytochrome c oxidase subunit 4 n=1 Tax=Cellulosimicrobium TaxID=157920 RepID=UPI0014592F0B|nr:cytochrome c oxidase subunit 4 [Cellulosimicrobium sp. XJ-DQ-B-000]MDQ8041755.1 cytochrome c oxidase subunit 4 [Cellulosimicrobium sp. XJ-DQ-B-000]NMF27113.1 cytochrome c oxidase subunit 4 [Cellulosimicrobium aquatile]